MVETMWMILQPEKDKLEGLHLDEVVEVVVDAVVYV